MEKFEGNNWAVLKKVQVLLYRYGYFPPFQNPVDFDDFSFENGENFEEIPHIFESAGFREYEQEDEGGHKWVKEVVLRIPKLRNEVSEFLELYSGRRLVLLITDMNDENFLVFPVRMSRQRNIPGQAAGLNYTGIQFSGEWTLEAPSVINIPESS
jgi:hypothetical protein